MKKIGLCLGGGGARGLSHIEILKTLDEMQIKPAVISGTSMGAVIGAFYAAGLSGAEIEKMLYELGILKPAGSIKKNIKHRSIKEMLDEAVDELKDFYNRLEELSKMIDISYFNHSSFIKGAGVTKYLRKKLPVQTFEELKIPLKIVATDYWNASEVIFDKGELVPAIRASLSIPAVFEPVKFSGKVLIDGGITNNLPYDIIVKQCDRVIAVDVSGERVALENPKLPNLFENMMNAYEILQNSVVNHQMKITKPEIYIKPTLKDVRILDFHKVEYILECGKQAATELKEILAKTK
jgi:NTE family protein